MNGHAVCTAHEGRHGLYEGRCVLVGSEVPRPFTFRPGGVCADCGASLDVMRARGERRAQVVLAGTTTPHRCRRPAVDMDADVLAEAIVRASRAARQERPPQQPQTVQTDVQTSQQTVFAGAREGAIRGVEVVRPE